MTRSRFHLLGPARWRSSRSSSQRAAAATARRPAAPPGAAPAATTRRGGDRRLRGPTRTSPATVSIAGVWTGDEQKNFQAVLDGFKEQYPNVTVKYNPAGDQLPTVLATAVAGGKPPDMAAVAQPGLMRDFQAQGELKPIDYAKDAIAADFGQSWIDLGTVDGKLYGLDLQGRQQVDRLVQRPGVHGRGRARRRRRATSCSRTRGTLQASGLPGVLDRRRRRLDAHRPVREHLPAPGGPGEVRPAVHARRSRGPTSRSRTR